MITGGGKEMRRKPWELGHGDSEQSTMTTKTKRDWKTSTSNMYDLRRFQNLMGF
jgi:hypothetical protein